MANSVRFWGRIAARYARRPVADEAAYQEKLRITREYLSPDLTVLEFGCGTGSTAIAHAPHVKQVLASDVSPKMIEIAREKAAAAGVDNVSFEVAALDDLEAADGSIDAVLGLSILHLLSDRDAAIATVKRMLKPGGAFVSSTACVGESMKFFKYVGPPLARLGLIPMVRVFTVDQLVASVKAAGFEIEHQWLPRKGAAVFIVARKPA